MGAGGVEGDSLGWVECWEKSGNGVGGDGSGSGGVEGVIILLTICDVNVANFFELARTSAKMLKLADPLKHL